MFNPAVEVLKILVLSGDLDNWRKKTKYNHPFTTRDNHHLVQMDNCILVAIKADEFMMMSNKKLDAMIMKCMMAYYDITEDEITDESNVAIIFEGFHFIDGISYPLEISVQHKIKKLKDIIGKGIPSLGTMWGLQSLFPATITAIDHPISWSDTASIL